MLNWIVWNRTVYVYKMDLALNNLQWLICHRYAIIPNLTIIFDFRTWANKHANTETHTYSCIHSHMQAITDPNTHRHMQASNHTNTRTRVRNNKQTNKQTYRLLLPFVCCFFLVPSDVSWQSADIFVYFNEQLCMFLWVGLLTPMPLAFEFNFSPKPVTLQGPKSSSCSFVYT